MREKSKTFIGFGGDSSEAEVYTDDPRLLDLFNFFCGEYPQYVRKTGDHIIDGEVKGCCFLMPKSAVRFNMGQYARQRREQREAFHEYFRREVLERTADTAENKREAILDDLDKLDGRKPPAPEDAC